MKITVMIIAYLLIGWILIGFIEKLLHEKPDHRSLILIPTWPIWTFYLLFIAPWKYVNWQRVAGWIFKPFK